MSRNDRNSWMPRAPEPEVMDDLVEVRAYREADFSEVNGALAELLIRLAGWRGRAVDLGTGPAGIALELCARAPGWRVVAVDASKAMLVEARREIRQAGLAGAIELLLADAIRTEAPSAGFDLVFSNSLLHHLSDPWSFWAEAWRLARPGGWIAIQDLFRPSSAAAARKIVRRHAGSDSALLRKLFYRSLLAAYRPEEVEEQLRFAGLRGLHVKKISDRHLLVAGKKKA
ncbi:MAG: class I SAM-dependent methyltransferase [Planctomycetes bacterium]|nr:class I SAM-dependent methyltransferase [Planctomycetota bacterium]